MGVLHLKYDLTFYLCLIGSTLLVPQRTVAEPLTLNAAIDRVLTHHPTVGIQQYDIEAAKGHHKTAAQWPNPTLDYSREDLSDNGVESGEWIAGVDIPLMGLWRRGARMDAAQARVEEAAWQASRLRTDLRFAVQQRYVEAYFAAQQHRAWQKTHALFVEVARIARTRLEEGDISAYEQQRLSLEARHFQLREAEARLHLKQAQRRLAFLLNDALIDSVYELTTAFPSTLPSMGRADFESKALEHRAEVHIAQAGYRAVQADHRAIRRQRWPAAHLFIGYKEQQDEFRGTAAQVRVELPLFDRKQGALQRTEATTKQQALRTEWVEKQVRQEVRDAYEQCRFYQEQLAHLGTDQAWQALLATARYAYAEGEMSLIEWIDAIRTASEAVAVRYDLLEQYQLSLFALEQTTGTVLIDLE